MNYDESYFISNVTFVIFYIHIGKMIPIFEKNERTILFFNMLIKMS